MKSTGEIHKSYKVFEESFIGTHLEAPDKNMVLYVIDKKIREKQSEFVRSFFDGWSLEDTLKLKHLILTPKPKEDDSTLPPPNKTTRKNKQSKNKKGIYVI